MTETQTQLWARLCRMQLDPPGSAIQFIDKLIRETGWTRAFAARAIEEYRKYLLIAATAGHSVSPSNVVDQVWHVHLLYTRHYWQVLAREILGFDFHHEPAIGTVEDRGRLNDAYEQTRHSYVSIFGDIPEDIWPARPEPDRFRRVDASRNFIVPRGLLLASAGLIAAVAIICMLVALLT